MENEIRNIGKEIATTNKPANEGKNTQGYVGIKKQSKKADKFSDTA